MDQALERKILDRGREFFASISGESLSIFSKNWWTDKVMNWSMRNEDFKVQMFRFVDVMPYLSTPELLQRHIREYFADVDKDAPFILRWSAKAAGMGGPLFGRLTGSLIRSNIEGMGRQFIIGQNVNEAMKGLAALRKDGFAFTVDLLGEASVNEEESDAYAAGYHEVLDALAAEQDKWSALTVSGPGQGSDASLDWGSTPKVNISIKPSALYSQARPVAQEDSIEGIYGRLAPIYRKVMEIGGFMCIDMEQLKYREMTIELYKRLRGAPEFRHYPHLCLVLQAYLRDCEEAINDLIAWSKREKLPIALRLVKGAYWDAETVMAKQCDWPVPVWTRKPETDLCYERCARLILQNHENVYFACASHNVRTIAAVMEMAAALNVPGQRYEFQVLYGMGAPVRKGLRNVAGKVRLYCPYGELIPGMAYLVRRLLENTANESFLRQSFVDGATIERLLENPALALEREDAARREKAALKNGKDKAPSPFPPFSNEPLVDFTIPANRQAYVKALADVRAGAGGTLPLYINNKDVTTDLTLPTVNPANPDEVMAHICQAGVAEIDQAIASARAAAPLWRDTPPLERAIYLRKAAAVARRRIYELSALQTLEVGKQWDQAYNDVAEGIDFLEYYAREMLRLGAPRRMGRAPGEHNTLFYQPKGIAAVIAPWNFPFAIAMGMVCGAIVTGNPVIFKPSSLA
ncbi:MAG: proline dehydrogenase family protein, partial [Desulfovibrio sp.]|nr:proline dehydrogenase family protein [Desulfovibrio sp.]